MSERIQTMYGTSDTATATVGAGVAQGASRVRVYSVISGKGGVGKSNLCINLGIALSRFGHRVLVIDADLGLANLDLLMGLTPRYNLSHLLTGKKSLDEVILSGPSGLRLLPANSNAKVMSDVVPKRFAAVIDSLRAMPEIADTVFIDTGGGISDNIVEFLACADEAILVTTPEPTSIMDSYGIIKILAQEKEQAKVNLLVNMAVDQADAQHVGETMRLVTRQFYNVTMTELGWVGYDPNVPRAVRQQQPFVLLYPTSRASKAVIRTAMKLGNYDVGVVADHGLASVLRKWISYIR